MKPRERVIASINFSGPDRAPRKHSPLSGALIKYGESLIDIFVRYPQDFGPDRLRIPKVEDLAPGYKKGINMDEWGTTWAVAVDGVYGQVHDYPIKTWDDLDTYTFPPEPQSAPDYSQELGKLKANVAESKDKGYFVYLGFKPGNFYEKMQHLRGFRNLLMAFLTKPKQLYEFADRLLEYNLKAISYALEAKPDGVALADDWGTQERLMVKPEFWRKFFKPRYKQMLKLIHDGGASTYFHSDGYIMDILPDLAEIGVDTINPQFSCFDLEKLADTIGEKMCVSSDIDRQYVLPRGTTKEVDAYVKKVVELFSHGGRGGLICRGEINIDVPLKNMEAMYRAFKRYGKYR